MKKMKQFHLHNKIVCLLFFIPFVNSCGLNLPYYNAVRADGDWEKALDLTRGWTRADAYHIKTTQDRFRVRQYALDAVTNYALANGSTKALDDEAKRYYEEGLQQSLNWEEKALFNRLYGQYLQKTGRAGKALVYLHKAREQAAKVTNIFNMILADSLLANSYRDIGQYDEESKRRHKTLNRAQQYFQFGILPTDEAEWFGYRMILLSHMDFLSREKTPDEILQLWQILKLISKKQSQADNINRKFFSGYLLPSLHYLNIYGEEFHIPHAESHLSVARMLARAGDIPRSQDFLKKAKLIWRKESSHHHRKQDAINRQIVCSEGEIDFHANDFSKAIQKLEECKTLSRKSGSIPDFHLFQMLGESFEQIGNLKQAFECYESSIQYSEKLRLTFDIQERATFFRTAVRRSYWGLIRLYALQAQNGLDETAFLRALKVNELTRSRQLGEILFHKQNLNQKIQSLADIQTLLEDHDLLLNYVFLEHYIILFAISNSEWEVFFIPIDPEAFRKEVRTLAIGLSTYTSDINTLKKNLVDLSKKILGPINLMLKGKDRLIVLPDGPLNLIPFDVLSDNPGTFHPLIFEKAIVLQPSLSLFLAQSSMRKDPEIDGFWGVGDPAYGEATQMAPRLPETRKEVETIAGFFTGKQVQRIYGPEARETSIKHGKLENYAYLHFATHGILAGEIPGVPEPALILAPEENQDGFLTATEASRLQLKAKLTVLSACKTGTGKYVSGEGVMGMGRAFLIAGSEAVLVSLWSIDSQATVELMIAFYRHLKKGASPLQAQRQAKLDMMTMYKNGEGYAARGVRVSSSRSVGSKELHPYFWAPFILIGNVKNR